jgi:hypothetical protein
MATRHLPRAQVVLASEALGVDLGLSGVGGACALDCLGDEGSQLTISISKRLQILQHSTTVSADKSVSLRPLDLSFAQLTSAFFVPSTGNTYVLILSQSGTKLP